MKKNAKEQQVGAQAYTDVSGGPEINTTQASWLATRLCQKHETADEESVTFPNRGQWGSDWTGDVLPSTVIRAHASLPVRYREWLASINVSEWQDYRRKDVYARYDWVTARRFISRCARLKIGFHLSY